MYRLREQQLLHYNVCSRLPKTKTSLSGITRLNIRSEHCRRIISVLVTLLKEIEMQTIDIELTDEEFLAFAKEAHYKDITFNEYLNQILLAYIKKYKLEQTT